GDWLGPLISLRSDSVNYVSYSTEMLPYIIGEKENALVLGSGTGRQINIALINNSHNITAVEPNKALLNLLTNVFQNEVDSVYNKKQIQTINTSPRTYIISSDTKYDLIILPIIDAFGGTSGLFALQEQYLLTKESFGEIRSRLYDNGIISITTWIDYPYRNPLKIIATIAEVLDEQGVYNPTEYIAAIKNWNTITFAVKKTPLTELETDRIRSFCNAMNFDPVILPDLKPEEREKYNRLQDSSLYVLIDSLLSSQAERDKIYNEYQFNIKPATDNRPYFSQFLLWKSIPLLADLFGNQSVAFFEIGYLLLYITFFQILVLAVFFIIVPLFKIGFKGGNKLHTLIYFSGLGLGYMFIEIILIQRFTLYFGNVIYAAASVVCLMLVSSGFGSLVSQKFNPKPQLLLVVLSVIVISLLIYTIFLSDMLKITIGSDLPVKSILSALIIAPPAFFMGMPFPLGLRLLSQDDKAQIPWAWGINGVFSVIATVLATIAAVELGFVWVMIFAMTAYLLSLSVNFKRTS
ncbi:MAG: hypothetical protein MUO34_12075, partial [Ignavibacteriaceae bacterium]|nr:hypothetical protein [Ignavibacteriaceae bacterium]